MWTDMSLRNLRAATRSISGNRLKTRFPPFRAGRVHHGERDGLADHGGIYRLPGVLLLMLLQPPARSSGPCARQPEELQEHFLGFAEIAIFCIVAIICPGGRCWRRPAFDW